MTWWKKKQKEDLELKEEEREASISTPLFKFGRKRVYVPKGKEPYVPKVEEPEKQQNTVKKPVVIEDTTTIAPDHYEPVDLGELQRGVIISLECSEKEGENFSFFIMSEETYKIYKKEGKAPKTLAKGSGENEYEEKATVKIAGRYYLILTTRATEYKRKVWYRVEVG